MPRALTLAEVIAGEAVSGSYEQRMADMRAIASVIANRAQQLGISPQDVVANSNEFSAYNANLPPGVGQNIIDMAQDAIDYVAENGPVHSGTFYATPSAVSRLPGQLNYETATTGHQFFSDPYGRAVNSAVGFRQPTANAYAFAQNLTDVPTPFSANQSGISSVYDDLAQTPNNWGLNKDVAPALTPTVEGWSAMASEAPIEAQPRGLLAASPTPNSFSDLAAAGPFGGQYAAPEDRFGPNPNPNGITQADIDRGLFGVSAAGFDPAFADNLMSPSNPVVPSAVTSTSFTPGSVVSQPAKVANFDASRLVGLLGPSIGVMDASRLATDDKTSRIGSNVMADMGRMLPSIDPMTNTQSFMDQPAATGILSGEHQIVQAQAEQALQNALQAQQTAAASYNVPAAGLLAANAPLSAQATVNSLVSPSAITAPAQINATATPEQMAAGYSQMAASAAPAGLLGLSGNNLNTIDLSNNIVATPSYTPTNTLADVQAPTLDTVSVAEQPSIAPTVEGPATTSALDQQQQQTALTQQARTINSPAQANPSLSFGQRLGAMVNPGTAIGGLLGGIALGPLGGIVGGLLGNSVYGNSSATGLLGSNSFVSPTNQIGGGVSNIASIYSGQQSPGTYAVASNGATITAQPGGYTSYENKYGVRETIGPDGKIASDWSGLFSGDDSDDAETEGGRTSGGLLGGWF